MMPRHHLGNFGAERRQPAIFGPRGTRTRTDTDSQSHGRARPGPPRGAKPKAPNQTKDQKEESAAAERDAVAALHGKATRDQLRSAMDAAFETIDADDDGTLAVAELKDAGLDPVLVARLDLDKDGALSRSEFVDAIVSSAFPSEGEPTHKSETLVRLVQQAVATVLRRRHSEAMAEAKAAAKAEAEAAAAAAQQELAAAKQALDAEKAEVASARASQGASSARDEAVARSRAEKDRT